MVSISIECRPTFEHLERKSDSSAFWWHKTRKYPLKANYPNSGSNFSRSLQSAALHLLRYSYTPRQFFLLFFSERRKTRTGCFMQTILWPLLSSVRVFLKVKIMPLFWLARVNERRNWHTAVGVASMSESFEQREVCGKDEHNQLKRLDADNFASKKVASEWEIWRSRCAHQLSAVFFFLPFVIGGELARSLTRRKD